MAEQKSTTRATGQGANLKDTQPMTQLEGIRQKVFMDRYSLKDADGQALEFYPEQLWARVARGIAAVEQSEEQQKRWEGRFYEALSGFQFVPGGRILAGAGSGHQVTFYNCMPPEQEVLTADGYRPISEIKIGDLVVTHRNRLRPVLHKFERETEEALYIIRPKKIGFDDLRVTGNHKVYVVRSEWVNRHKSRDGLRLQHEPDWIPAKDIRPGDFVAVAFNDEESSPDTLSLHDYVSGYETQDGKLFKATTRGSHGYVSDWGTHYKLNDSLALDRELCYLFGRWLGDGCVTHRSGTDIPSGIKIVFSLEEKEAAVKTARIIEAKFAIEGSIKLSSTERWYDLWVNSMPLGEFFKAFLGCYSYGKQIPDQLMHLPAELTLELLHGLFSADGYVSGNKLGIVLSNRTLSVQVHQLLLRLGYVFSIRENTHRLGHMPAYRIQAAANECAPLFEQFFGVQAPEHSIDLKYYFEYDGLQWVRIDEIAVEDYAGIVLDIEVEEDHSFVSAGVVVSNCYVIPSPEDSRQGILDNLKLMTEIMARGGGVGINLSTLRPRGSYIKTVNGTASGPCSWAQLYSVATGDVIQQGGSRRGALMLMLDDTHPDIEEFITVKRTAGKIEHANLSVCISDKFMQAVKDDADWELVWQGEVKKTIRARYLWDLICTSAWESAEPGMVFIDRYNKLSNTWYYEDIRCVNPCVTGDTLIYTDQGLIPAEELAERGTPVTVASPEIAIRELAFAGHASEGNGLQTITQSSGSVSFRQASHVFPTGVKPVYRLQTREGYTLRLTSDHKVLTNKGWIAAGELVAGDKIHALDGQGDFDSIGNARLSLATFESLISDGEEMVYDLSEPEAHLFVANGLVVHNCGEQGLPPYGVCNLGALNLSAFVVDGKMDYERLAEMSKVAMRFLDNVVDANEYFIEENRVAQLGTRRTGLGTMGLADALIKMEIPYGSEESVPVIESIYTTIRDAAYEASADIAAEKGAFSHFERDKYMQGEFIKQLPKAIQEKIKKQGTRNAVLLTQAPTGTTSLFSGVSSGIEPVYDFAMVRRDRTGEHILYHPLLQAWRDAHPNEPTPKYFVSSNDLTPEEHVRVQATIQRYTDSSISKTVNAPNSHTVEQVQTLYRLAYEMGCKGVTYYRDGSRDAVLTRVADEKKAEQPETQTAKVEPVTSIQDGVKPRPAVVHGYTRQVNAPEGKINVTINSDEHGPLEVFVNVGKAGSDIAALAEALGRLISLNLRVLSPLSQADRAKEIADQLRSIGGSRSVGFGPQQVRSLPDAVARALELHVEAMEQAQAKSSEAHETAEVPPIANGKDASHANGSHADSPLGMTRLSITGNLCPQCGCNTMVFEEGCKKCYNCGHSEC